MEAGNPAARRILVLDYEYPPLGSGPRENPLSALASLLGVAAELRFAAPLRREEVALRSRQSDPWENAADRYLALLVAAS